MRHTSIQEVILKKYREYSTNMKRLLYIICAFALICTSCAKEVLKTIEVDLGKKTVGVEAGSFPVKVTVEGVWYAESQSSWIAVDESLHDSDGTFVVRYDSNASSEGDWRFNRAGKVLVKTYDGAVAGVITVWQKGISPSIEFSPVNLIPSAGGPCKVSCMTNITGIEQNNVTVTCEASWISYPVWSRDGMSVDFTAQAGSSREAVLKVVHTDAWGIVTEVECKVRQEE